MKYFLLIFVDLLSGKGKISKTVQNFGLKIRLIIRMPRNLLFILISFGRS
jgi:hypothetical protein